MHPNEIVVRVVKGNRRLEVRQLLAERQREARESLALHADAEILPFHVRRGDMLAVRRPMSGSIIASTISGGK